MRKVVAQSLVLSVLTICLGHQSFAQYWSKKPFDATYNMTASTGGATVRMICDGQGRQRNETATSSGKVVSIIDNNKKEMWSLIEAQRMAMRIPYNPDPATQATDTEGFKSMNAKALGTKVIDGHPCHGWQTVHQGTTVESWTGDDIGCLVYSTSKGKGYESSMKLVKFSATKPDPSMFSLPQGYKVMDVPGATSHGLR